MDSTMMPKVTVIMSCYNHEKYVAEAMESILNQTYRNIELFVVNDGSTDKSAEIIKSYCTDSRVHFIDLKENTSAVGAFRILDECIAETDSKYVAIASSDDMWILNKLEKQIDFMEKNPSYKACFTYDKIKLEEGGTLQGLSGEDYSYVENRNRFQWLKFLLAYGNCINAVSALIDRMVYMELGGFNWTFRNMQDYGLWISLVSKYPIYVIPEPLTIYRKHTSNLSTAPEVNARGVNEQLFIFTQKFFEISDEDFKKSFFNEFIYYNSVSATEILAEKIVFLLCSEAEQRKQVGFFLYMQNSGNKELQELLEHRYKLSAKVFHDLTGMHGVEFFFISREVEKKYDISQVEVFCEYINEKNILPQRLYDFKMQCLRILLQIINMGESDSDVFYQFRDVVWALQDLLNDNDTENWCSVIIGEEYAKDIDMIREYLQAREKEKIIFSVIPRKENMFLDVRQKEYWKADNIESLDLFDCKEHRVKYYWEFEREPNKVYFYGCCNEDYPVWDIIDGVSMAVKLYAIRGDIQMDEQVSLFLRKG